MIDHDKLREAIATAVETTPYVHTSKIHARMCADKVLVELEAQGLVVVPKVPTEEQWGGLARDIFLAWDVGCKTPRQLFAQLEMCGKSIPAWLKSEREMTYLDHVPSKGTRAAIIYRAMLEAAPKPEPKT